MMRRTGKGSKGELRIKQRGDLRPVCVVRWWFTPVYTILSVRVPAVKLVIWRGGGMHRSIASVQTKWCFNQDFQSHVIQEREGGSDRVPPPLMTQAQARGKGEPRPSPWQTAGPAIIGPQPTT